LTLFNGFFKFRITTRASRLGERVVTTLRSELYQGLLRLPPERMSGASPGQFVAMITGEAEALGGFIGDAVAVPVMQGGTLLVYLVFIFVQQPVLGIGTIALYPVQAWLIPKLQAKINSLSRDRIRLMRAVADQVGDTVSAFAESRDQRSAAVQIQAMDTKLSKLRAIRYEIFERRFFMKYLNNSLNKIVPLLFFSIGGYLTIKGNLSLGALVAVLAAYADMASPWKELLDYYQQKEDMSVRFHQVVREFFFELSAPKAS
jgi:ABC-type bacteriocin/lantibiotic exporter with double-glycine peptidase domain